MEIFFLLLLFLNSYTIECARILAVYPTPSISHQLVFRSLTDVLVKRGHHVTVITTDPKYTANDSPKNLTEIDVHELSYTMWKDYFGTLKENAGNGNVNFPIVGTLKLLSNLFRAQTETPKFQQIIKHKRKEYDLLLVEAYLKPALALSHVFKVPMILVSSLGGMKESYHAMGVSTHTFLYPNQIRDKIYNLTNLEKLLQLYNEWKFGISFNDLEEEDNEMLKTMFGPDTPTINELYKNIDLLMLNNNPIWVDNQPVPPNVVYINGLHISPPQALPRDLQMYLDSCKNGVIYFSLGTNVRPELLSPSKIQMLIKVFSRLPYNVLWKWNLNTLPGKSSNIKISKWLPQPDVLRHPHIKLFITQGGLQSTDEAIAAGVPLVGIPMIADQWYNVQKYVQNGIGVQLDLAKLTEDEFQNAIETVINDKSYRENILRLRNLFQDEPMTAADRAVWWVEYVLRHGGAKHLRAAGANVTWRQYLELDLVLIVLFVAISAFTLLAVIVYCIFKYLNDNIRNSIKIKMS